MLKYIGHPLIDVGVATITAFAEKQDPATLTEADLDKVADYIEEEYTRQPLKSFMTVAFTSNAWFSQDAYNPDKPDLSDEERIKRRQTRESLAKRHLRQWRQQELAQTAEVDIFTGEPTITQELSGKLLPGRAARAQIPLALGDEYINFFPHGMPGLPVSGKTVLCLQAFPLGCAKCSGRLLAVHSDRDDMTYLFASEFLKKNRDAIQRAQLEGSSKMPETEYAQRTLLVDTLTEIQRKKKDMAEDMSTFSLTAYHLSNSGQGPGLDIYHLPLQIIGFLMKMQEAAYYQEWDAIVRRAWEVAPLKRGKPAPDFQPRRNWLYEDLFDLPETAARFIRTYFLRMALRYARGDTDPRRTYSLQQEPHLVSWKIAAEFLRRILNMEKERVEEIRQLADRLAEYVSSQNDRRFFREFYLAQRYDYFRDNLIKATIAYARQGHEPLVQFDPYIAIFEEGNELARPDWRLARDLVLIRMIEQLHAQGWLHRNVDALPESPVTSEEPETEAAI